MSMAIRKAVDTVVRVAEARRHRPSMARQVPAAIRNGVVRPGADETYADGDDSTWMGIDWPAMTHRARVRGTEVNYVDTGGDKPPLLFIHGLGACWQCWVLNLAHFMQTHRCVALDLPGFGESPMPDREISISGYARVVNGLCEALGIEATAVIGNSMGGFVGAELAIAHTTRVKRLVLVSPAGITTEHLARKPLLTIARLLAGTETRLTTQRDAFVRRPRLRRLALQAVVRYPEKLSLPLTWELVHGSGRPGFLPALDALIGYSIRDRLPRIEIPVLLVWGRNDILVPIGDAEDYAQLIGANARKVIFEDTGHVPMIERPSRFNPLVADFLAGERAPGADLAGVSA
jgi:pimeloyl-ACP methyl ester carboxylesterase